MTDQIERASEASQLPFPTSDNHPVNAEPAQAPQTAEPTEDALDNGIEESFPASDPVSVSVARLIPPSTSAVSPAADQSVAGEEDPGASVDVLTPHLGDEAPPGTPGTGEGLCRDCGGKGRAEGGGPCPTCDGTGKVTVGIGGA